MLRALAAGGDPIASRRHRRSPRSRVITRTSPQTLAAMTSSIPGGVAGGGQSGAALGVRGVEAGQVPGGHFPPLAERGRRHAPHARLHDVMRADGARVPQHRDESLRWASGGSERQPPGAPDKPLGADAPRAERSGRVQ